MEQEKTIFDEPVNYFFSYITPDPEDYDDDVSYYEELYKDYDIRVKFEKKFIADELIPIARKALDDDGIVYGFQHYLKDKDTKELYVVETWDFVPDIRNWKEHILRKAARNKSF